MRFALATAWLAAILVAGFFLGFLTVASLAQSHNHPPQDAAIHELFYKDWKRPDLPNISCCNLEDCAPAQARMVDGVWYAKRERDADWLKIPPEKIEQNRDNPDGRSHLCANYSSKQVYCFIPGGGT